MSCYAYRVACTIISKVCRCNPIISTILSTVVHWKFEETRVLSIKHPINCWSIISPNRQVQKRNSVGVSTSTANSGILWTTLERSSVCRGKGDAHHEIWKQVRKLHGCGKVILLCSILRMKDWMPYSFERKVALCDNFRRRSTLSNVSGDVRPRRMFPSIGWGYNIDNICDIVAVMSLVQTIRESGRKIFVGLHQDFVTSQES